jgi:hypothetical protein
MSNPFQNLTIIVIPLGSRASVVVYKLDIRGSVHHSTIHKEKIQQGATVYQILLFHICMMLNIFRATHRPLSGA